MGVKGGWHGERREGQGAEAASRRSTAGMERSCGSKRARTQSRRTAPSPLGPATARAHLRNAVIILTISPRAGPVDGAGVYISLAPLSQKSRLDISMYISTLKHQVDLYFKMNITLRINHFQNFFKKKLSTKSRRWPTLALRLPSALTSLTAEFGMGSGVSSSLEAPRQ